MRELTLLYAEDDQETRENYAYILNDYFHKVYTAENGKEALRIYHEKKPDALLLDISMPIMNGLEMAKEVRRHNEEIPIIIFTAHSERSKLLNAVNLKIEKYLIKPIEYDVLKDTMLALIKEIENNSSISLHHGIIWDKMSSSLYYQKEHIKLAKRPTLLLELLIVDPGSYCPSDDLIVHIWYDEMPTETHDNKLRQLVHRLNNKIFSYTKNNNPFIENTYGLGYRLVFK